MKLFLANCGYYEPAVLDGIFEMHITLPIVAESIEAAKLKAKEDTFFISRGIRAHVDGITELKEVGGYSISVGGHHAS